MFPRVLPQLSRNTKDKQSLQAQTHLWLGAGGWGGFCCCTCSSHRLHLSTFTMRFFFFTIFIPADTSGTSGILQSEAPAHVETNPTPKKTTKKKHPWMWAHGFSHSGENRKAWQEARRSRR